MKYVYLVIFFLLVSYISYAENQNNEIQPLPEHLILDGRPYVSRGKEYRKDEAHLIERLFCHFGSDAIIRWHSFDGIEQLVNLKSIWIHGEIPDTVDMSPVSSLYSLEELSVWNVNRLPDLTRLEQLSTIVINYPSHLKSLEGISAPNVRRIFITNNEEIDSLEPLNNLPHLEELEINSYGKEYRIADISSLPSLKELEIRWIGGKLDLQGIENLTALERLFIPSAGTFNLEGIGMLSNLKMLGLNLISPEPSLEFLRGMPNLTRLYLEADSNREGFPFESEPYQILDVSPLATIKTLQNLSCMNFIIKNISSLDVLEAFVRENDEDFYPHLQLGGSRLFDESETSRHKLIFWNLSG